MKKNKFQYLFPVILSILFLGLYAGNDGRTERYVTKQQVLFDPNNISTFIWNTGVFNQDMRTNNTPGFEWPKGTGKFAIFTTGFTIGAYVNGGLRLASASFNGEYEPGYCQNGNFLTDSRFKFYTVKPTDSYINNPDWLNWGLMVPYGAPFVDVNHNGMYDFIIDTPGVRGAAQTIFICITDANPANHTSSEGFSGGTLPLGAEVHLTAWAYTAPGLQDIQFFKWEVVNKNIYDWDSTYFSIVCDPDLGDAVDDYIGCDTIRELGYVYNSDNQDGFGSGYSYGANPPASGFVLLKSAAEILSNQYVELGMTSYDYFDTPAGPVCENDPSSPQHSYNYMRGYKRDGASWLCPSFNPFRRIKLIYNGDPETNQGWNEYQGRIHNCGSDTTGNIITPSPPGDRKFVLSSGSGNLNVNPGDTQVIIAAQLIARGTSNLNSVTKLKQLADVAIQLYNNGFVIGVESISSEVPQQFTLYQNYPNPFNPTTKIKFSIPPSKVNDSPWRGARGKITQLVIYDILGREIASLIPPLRGGQEGLNPGTYEVDWNGSDYPSGVYFYRLINTDASSPQANPLSITRKMVLIK
jgi:hypothetical protein